MRERRRAKSVTFVLGVLRCRCFSPESRRSSVQRLERLATVDYSLLLYGRHLIRLYGPRVSRGMTSTVSWRWVHAPKIYSAADGLATLFKDTEARYPASSSSDIDARWRCATRAYWGLPTISRLWGVHMRHSERRIQVAART